MAQTVTLAVLGLLIALCLGLAIAAWWLRSTRALPPARRTRAGLPIGRLRSPR